MVKVVESEDIERFYKVNKLTFERQSEKIPYSLDLIKKIDETLSNKKQRKILLTKDQKGQIHAGIYLVWDQKCVYNLMLGANTDLRSSGAIQLLLWEGIQLAAYRQSRTDL